METEEINTYLKKQFGDKFSLKKATPISGLENIVAVTINRSTPKRSIYTDSVFECKDEGVGIILKKTNGTYEYRTIVDVTSEGFYGISQTYGSKCKINKLKYDAFKKILSISANWSKNGGTDMYFKNIDAEIKILNEELGAIKVLKKMKGESEKNICGNYGPPTMKDVTNEIEFNGV